MRNDFKPVHLQEANRRLERELLSKVRYQEQDDSYKDETVKASFWEKLLGLFKSKSSEFPEELDK